MVRRMGTADFEEDKGITAREIITDDTPHWSGLYNADGFPLFKKKEPFGFIGRKHDSSL